MGKSVFFRAFEPDDAVFIHKLKNNHELLKDALGMPRPSSLEEVKLWVNKYVMPDPYNYYFAICLNDETKRIIGYISLINIHFINSSAETGAIVIEKNYQDGISWIESVLYIHYFAFEVLHLNRLYGCHLESQNISDKITDLFFWESEGISKQAAYKNGKYWDVKHEAILAESYFKHKLNGDYEFRAILKRLRKLVKINKSEKDLNISDL